MAILPKKSTLTEKCIKNDREAAIGHSEKRKCFGFTLLEMVIAAAVITFLSAISVTAGRNAARRARYSRAEAEVECIVLAISSMHADTGSYPPSAACYLEDPSLFNHEPGSVGLAALRMAAAPSYSGVNSRRWNGPYLMNRMTWEESGAGFLDLMDPWGNPYFYFVFRNAVGTAPCVITPEEDSGDLEHLYSFHYYFQEAPANAKIRIINTAPSSGGGCARAIITLTRFTIRRENP